MPLKIDIKKGEKLVINGAVIENVGVHTKILLYNQAAILREKEVLSADDCVTPASRVYFALQCAYMFPDRKDHHLGLCEQYLQEYLKACPSAAEIGDDIRHQLADGHIYKGLRQTRKLIGHEMSALSALPENVSKLFELASEEDEESNGQEQEDDKES